MLNKALREAEQKAAEQVVREAALKLAKLQAGQKKEQEVRGAASRAAEGQSSRDKQRGTTQQG